MLLEDLFRSLIERSHPTEAERSQAGVVILRRLKDLGGPAQSRSDTAADSREEGIQASKSGSKQK